MRLFFLDVSSFDIFSPNSSRNGNWGSEAKCSAAQSGECVALIRAMLVTVRFRRVVEVLSAAIFTGSYRN